MPGEDLHLAVHARSQAHDARQVIAGMTERESVAWVAGGSPRYVPSNSGGMPPDCAHVHRPLASG